MHQRKLATVLILVLMYVTLVLQPACVLAAPTPSQPPPYSAGIAPQDRNQQVEQIEAQLRQDRENRARGGNGLNIGDAAGGFVAGAGEALFDTLIGFVRIFLDKIVRPLIKNLIAYCLMILHNPNIAAVDRAEQEGGNYRPLNAEGTGTLTYDIVPYDVKRGVIYGFLLMRAIAICLLLLLFIGAIWKYWIQATVRSGTNLFLVVGRLIATAGLILFWPIISEFYVQISNEMIDYIYRSINPIALDNVIAQIANKACDGAAFAFLGGMAGTLLTAAGAKALSGPATSVTSFLCFVFLGICIYTCVAFIVLKAIQIALIMAQYMFAPLFLAFYVSPDTERLATGFIRSCIEVSLWTFIWAGLMRLLVVILLVDGGQRPDTQVPFGQFLMVIGVLQIMLKVPEFMSKAQISPVSEFINPKTFASAAGTLFQTAGGALGLLAKKAFSPMPEYARPPNPTAVRSAGALKYNTLGQNGDDPGARAGSGGPPSPKGKGGTGPDTASDGIDPNNPQARPSGAPPPAKNAATKRLDELNNNPGGLNPQHLAALKNVLSGNASADDVDKAKKALALMEPGDKSLFEPLVAGAAGIESQQQNAMDEINKLESGGTLSSNAADRLRQAVTNPLAGARQLGQALAKLDKLEKDKQIDARKANDIRDALLNGGSIENAQRAIDSLNDTDNGAVKQVLSDALKEEGERRCAVDNLLGNTTSLTPEQQDELKKVLHAAHGRFTKAAEIQRLAQHGDIDKGDADLLTRGLEGTLNAQDLDTARHIAAQHEGKEGKEELAGLRDALTAANAARSMYRAAGIIRKAKSNAGDQLSESSAQALLRAAATGTLDSEGQDALDTIRQHGNLSPGEAAELTRLVTSTSNDVASAKSTASNLRSRHTLDPDSLHGRALNAIERGLDSNTDLEECLGHVKQLHDDGLIDEAQAASLRSGLIAQSTRASLARVGAAIGSSAGINSSLATQVQRAQLGPATVAQSTAEALAGAELEDPATAPVWAVLTNQSPERSEINQSVLGASQAMCDYDSARRSAIVQLEQRQQSADTAMRTADSDLQTAIQNNDPQAQRAAENSYRNAQKDYNQAAEAIELLEDMDLSIGAEQLATHSINEQQAFGDARSHVAEILQDPPSSLQGHAALSTLTPRLGAVNTAVGAVYAARDAYDKTESAAFQEPFTLTTAGPATPAIAYTAATIPEPATPNTFALRENQVLSRGVARLNSDGANGLREGMSSSNMHEIDSNSQGQISAYRAPAGCSEEELALGRMAVFYSHFSGDNRASEALASDLSPQGVEQPDPADAKYEPKMKAYRTIAAQEAWDQAFDWVQGLPSSGAFGAYLESQHGHMTPERQQYAIYRMTNPDVPSSPFNENYRVANQRCLAAGLPSSDDYMAAAMQVDGKKSGSAIRNDILQIVGYADAMTPGDEVGLQRSISLGQTISSINDWKPIKRCLEAGVPLSEEYVAAVDRLPGKLSGPRLAEAAHGVVAMTERLCGDLADHGTMTSFIQGLSDSQIGACLSVQHLGGDDYLNSSMVHGVSELTGKHGFRNDTATRSMILYSNMLSHDQPAGTPQHMRFGAAAQDAQRLVGHLKLAGFNENQLANANVAHTILELLKIPGGNSLLETAAIAYGAIGDGFSVDDVKVVDIMLRSWKQGNISRVDVDTAKRLIRQGISPTPKAVRDSIDSSRNAVLASFAPPNSLVPPRRHP